ncbi:MAG: hypothetical protein EOO01_16795, partial [Chitinophagaceae bacterium]
MKTIDEDLLNKIKTALVKSGFPLEMEVAKILEKLGWDRSIGTQYLDFETSQIRESDIIANKIIDGVEVNIIIECKKSTEKQLILYQPERSPFINKVYQSEDWFKFFPKIEFEKPYMEVEFRAQFFRLPLFQNSFTYSSNIIFTKGNQVEQNNTPFFTSLNGVLKRSIIEWSKSNQKTRSIFLYVVIYDGYLLKLTQD